MKSPEGYEKDEICKYLDSIGCWYFRPYQAGFGRSGIPDIVGCMDGVFLAIEVKRDGKEPTPLQHKRIEEIHHAGGIAFWGTAKKVLFELKSWRDANWRANRILP